MIICKKFLTIALLMCAIGLFTGIVATKADSLEITKEEGLPIVESVRVSERDGTAQLVIKMTRAAQVRHYTALEPLRFVVDMPGVSPGNLSGPIKVDKALIKKIVVTGYETDAGMLTRIEAELVQNIEPVLRMSKENPGEIILSYPVVTATKTVMATTQALKKISVKTSVCRKILKGSLSTKAVKSVLSKGQKNKKHSKSAAVHKSSNQHAAVVSKSALKAKLTRVYEKERAIVFEVDQNFKKYLAFSLDEPKRYVIDLYGVNTEMPRFVPLAAAGVSKVSIGHYSNKTRVVIYAAKGFSLDPCVEKSADSLTVKLGCGQNNTSVK